MLIQRRSFLKTSTLVAVGIFFLFTTMTGPLRAAGDKPNIVVILADDLSRCAWTVPEIRVSQME